MKRKKTKKIYVGSVAVGGNSPVSVQSMTNSDTCDVKATVSQIRRLEKAGCDIVRVSVPDDDAAEVLGDIIKKVNTPVVADIHFNYRHPESNIQHLQQQNGAISTVDLFPFCNCLNHSRFD